MITTNVFDQPTCLDSFQYSDDLCFCKSALTHFCSPLAYQFASRTPVMHSLILRGSYRTKSKRPNFYPLLLLLICVEIFIWTGQLFDCASKYCRTSDRSFLSPETILSKADSPLNKGALFGFFTHPSAAISSGSKVCKAL